MRDDLCRCRGGCSRHRPARGRRAFVGGVAAGLLAAAALPARGARAADPTPRTTLTPDQALRLLKEGNDNFRMEAPFRAAQGRERRVELARGQAPFCVLIGCSDSRVPPELLFGRGPGTIDHAGHTVAFRFGSPAAARTPHTVNAAGRPHGEHRHRPDRGTWAR
jgi:carbonic anhydrase